MVDVFVYPGTACFPPQQAGDGAHRDIERGKLGPERIGGGFRRVRVGMPGIGCEMVRVGPGTNETLWVRPPCGVSRMSEMYS